MGSGYVGSEWVSVGGCECLQKFFSLLSLFLFKRICLYSLYIWAFTEWTILKHRHLSQFIIEERCNFCSGGKWPLDGGALMHKTAYCIFTYWWKSCWFDAAWFFFLTYLANIVTKFNSGPPPLLPQMYDFFPASFILHLWIWNYTQTLLKWNQARLYKLQWDRKEKRKVYFACIGLIIISKYNLN